MKLSGDKRTRMVEKKYEIVGKLIVSGGNEEWRKRFKPFSGCKPTLKRI